MKKFILLIGLLLCMCSCTVQSNLYRIKTVYRIDGGEPKTHVVDMLLQERYVPVYVCNAHPDGYELYITGETVLTHLSASKYYSICKGTFRIDVDSFEYEIIQSGKFSIFGRRFVSSDD